MVDLYATDDITKTDVFLTLNQYLSLGETAEGKSYIQKSLDKLSGAERDYALFTLSLLQTSEGEYDNAQKNLEQIESLPFFKEDVQFLKARLHFEKKDFKKSISVMSGLSKSFIYEQNGEVEYLTGLSGLQLKDFDLAYAKLRPLIRKWRRRPERPILLESLLTHALKDKAYPRRRYCDWFKKLYVNHPDYLISSSWSYNNNYMISGKNIKCSLKDKDKKTRLITSYRKGMSKNIQDQLLDVEDEKLKAKLQIEFSYLSGDMDKATALMEDLYGNKLYKDVSLLRTFSRYNYYSGNYDTAIEGYAKAIKLTKNSRLKAQQMLSLSRLHMNLNSFGEAEKLFSQISRKYRRTANTHSNRWFRSWNLYLNGEYSKAYDALSRLSNDLERKGPSYFSDLEKARYWSARALEKGGDVKKALKVYKKLSENKSPTYYALISSVRLMNLLGTEKQIRGFKIGSLNHESFLSPPWNRQDVKHQNKIAKLFDSLVFDERSLSSVDSSGEKTVSLESADEDDELAFDFDDLEELSIEENTKVFESNLKRLLYYTGLNFEDQAFKVLKTLQKHSKTKKIKKRLLDKFSLIQDYNGLSKNILKNFRSERFSKDSRVSNEYWRLAYPKAYDKLVEKSSQVYSVPTELVWAHIRAESFYNPNALSPVGAKGLLQIMPYTANKIFDLEMVKGQRVPASATSAYFVDTMSNHLMNPVLNIQVGSSYLGRLKKVFKGSYPLMAAAYNGGPHRVKLWSSQFGRIDMDEFIERIPFSETKSYVKKIIFFKYVYTSVYKSDSSVDLKKMIEPVKYHYKGTHPTKENWDAI